MTVTIDSTVIAALLAAAAFVFWLGRLSAGRARDISAPPAGLAASVTRPRVVGLRDPAALPPDVLAAIRAELTRGHKITAIKLMRDATGLGLAEAKQAVESLEG